MSSKGYIASFDAGLLYNSSRGSRGLDAEKCHSQGYEAYYDLQVQLHSGQVQRDYTVLHHGRLPVSVNQVWMGKVQGWEDVALL